MKKTGSENPADETEKSKAASAEPVERARLQADVAKQRVRIAKEELKRARKRLKEAKREARRARKQADAARKAWKQAQRARYVTDPAKPTAAEAVKKKKSTDKSVKQNNKVETEAGQSAPKKRAAPGRLSRPNRSNKLSNKSSGAPSRRKRAAPVKSAQSTRRTANKPGRKRVMTEANATVEVTPAANSEEVGTLDTTATNAAASVE
jgi:colicin import membrane protein